MTGDIADGAKWTFHFARPSDTFVDHGKDFDRLLLEQQMIVAKTLATDRPADVPGLYEERESVGQERI